LIKKSFKCQNFEIKEQGNNITNLWISMLSTSPEKEKNSLISCSVAPEERLPTFTDLTCDCHHKESKGKKSLTKTIKQVFHENVYSTTTFCIQAYLIDRKSHFNQISSNSKKPRFITRLYNYASKGIILWWLRR